MLYGIRHLKFFIRITKNGLLTKIDQFTHIFSLSSFLGLHKYNTTVSIKCRKLKKRSIMKCSKEITSTLNDGRTEKFTVFEILNADFPYIIKGIFEV